MKITKILASSALYLGAQAGTCGTLYTHYNQTGPKLDINGNNNRISSSWNDKVSSIIVPQFKTVTLYEHSNYKGKSWTIEGPAKIDRFGYYGWNDIVSSFKCAENLGVIYEHVNYGGKATPLVENKIWVGADNDKFSSVKIPNGIECTLYEDSRYRGRSWPISQANVPSFVSNGWNDKVSSYKCKRITGRHGTIYEHYNFGGRVYPLNGMVNWVGNAKNDKFSSIKVNDKSECTLYEHSYYGGKSWTLGAGEVSEFGSKGWNDIVSSFKCKSRFGTLYEHVNYQGKAYPIYGNSIRIGQADNDKFSSIKLAKGAKCTLYEHAYYRGRSWTVNGDNSNFVSRGWNDIVSSYKCF